MLCLHKLTYSFPHKDAISLLCQPHFLSFFHAQFSYYLYYGTFSEFPRWNHSLCSEDALLLTPSVHFSGYCIIISVHSFFPSLGLNLLEAAVLFIYLTFSACSTVVHTLIDRETVGGPGRWGKWEELLSFNKMLVMIPHFYYPEKHLS